MRVVLQFSFGGQLERAFLGIEFPHRVDVVLDGGAIFGPRPFGIVEPRTPDEFGYPTRFAFTCGVEPFETFMGVINEQAGKKYDFAWLFSCKTGVELRFDRWDQKRWAGPELVVFAAGVAKNNLIPIVDVAKKFVTSRDLLKSTLLSPVGRRATSDKWRHFDVFGT